MGWDPDRGIVLRARRIAFACAALVAACVLAAFPAVGAAATIASPFSSDAEGWTAVADAPRWVATGGNPNGYVEAEALPSQVVDWLAPAKFLGNRGVYYGGVLRVDRQGPAAPADVILSGAGTSLRYALPGLPATGWKRQEIELLPGRAAAGDDETTLRAVLGSLTGITIPAAAIDNVTLTNTLAAPAITSSESLTAKVGAATTFVVRSSGVPFPALTINGQLPPGMTFTDNGDGTGTLTGTPASGGAGTYAVLVSAANRLATSTQTLAIQVNQAPKITSATTTTFVAGADNTFTVNASGVPAPSLKVTSELPPGVTFADNHDGTGTLSGSPSELTRYPIKLQAVSAAGTNGQSFAVTVLGLLSPFVARTNYTRFDQTFPTAPEGPWDGTACVNNGYSLTNGGVDPSSGLPDDGVVVGRFEVHQGDHGTSDSGGDRCQIGLSNRALLGEQPFVESEGTANQGDVRFYHLSFGVGTDFPELPGYTTFAEWHQPLIPGSSPLSVETMGERSEYTGVVLRQIVNGKRPPPQTLVQFPTPRGRWADLVVELNLSTSPDLGYVRLWLDGRRVDEASSPNGVYDGAADDTFRGATIYSPRLGDPDWQMDFKVGNYRSKHNVEPSTVYHRFTTVAPTFAAAAGVPFGVAPPPRVQCGVGNLPPRPIVGQVYHPVLRVTNDAGDAVAGSHPLTHARVETFDDSGTSSGSSEQEVPITVPAAGAGETFALPDYVVPAGSPGAASVQFTVTADDGSFSCGSRSILLPVAAP